MDSTTQVFTILIILIGVVLTTLITQFTRRKKTPYALRNIPAYAVIPGMIGAAIEANRPVHLSFGSAGIGNENTLLALASAELMFNVIERAAISPNPPIITMSDAAAIPLAQDTLRKAYQSRDMLDRYRASSVRWYPSGPRSLVLAAALTGMMADDDVQANVLSGSFGAEVALIGSQAGRRNQSLIVTSDQLDGQAVALAMSDEPLIGEEIFVAGAYFNDRRALLAAAVTQDVLRWLLIITIIILVILNVADEEVGDILDVFLGG